MPIPADAAKLIEARDAAWSELQDARALLINSLGGDFNAVTVRRLDRAIQAYADARAAITAQGLARIETDATRRSLPHATAPSPRGE